MDNTILRGGPLGISRGNREKLAALIRGARGQPFSVELAAGVVGLDRRATRRLLARLFANGWLARVRRGLYAPAPVEASLPSQWRADPWIVADRLFAPCYIGGWTACEHWGLTEQIFRDIVVITARRVRYRRPSVQGTRFLIKTVPERLLAAGMKPVWRDSVQVLVSDPSRTIADILDDPRLSGGIRHGAEVVEAYFRSPHRDDRALTESCESLRNRTIFKRLGYLMEALEVRAPELIETCRTRMSAGYSILDPSVKAPGRILRRWRLRLNVQVSGPASPA